MENNYQPYNDNVNKQRFQIIHHIKHTQIRHDRNMQGTKHICNTQSTNTKCIRHIANKYGIQDEYKVYYDILRKQRLQETRKTESIEARNKENTQITQGTQQTTHYAT